MLDVVQVGCRGLSPPADGPAWGPRFPPPAGSPAGGPRLRVPAFIGREDAKGALETALYRALRFSAPQFVTVFGPLGIGKTRLVSEWLTALEERRQCRILRASASTLGQTSSPEAFGLLAAVLRDRFGLDEPIDEAASVERFRQELQGVFGDRRVAEIAALLGRYLGLPVAASPLCQAIASRPDQATDLARAVLCRFFEADAATVPLVIAIDDIHLADEASLVLFEQLASELGEAPLVLVATARPELQLRRSGWGRGPGSYTRIDLPALCRLEMDVFVKSALDVQSLAGGLAERAAVESGGNPFLLLELLHLYQHHGVLVADSGNALWFDEDGAGFLSLDLDPEAAAHARVAALSPPERDLLATGATFGPVFWTGGVIALGRLRADPPDPTAVFAPDPAIAEARVLLERLCERGILERRPTSGVAGESEWSFAGETERQLLLGAVDPDLLRERRRFAAQWLEGRLHAPQGTQRLEWLGELYLASEDRRRAGQCFLAAADAALSRMRHERAHGLYLRGIELLDLDESVRKMDAFHKLGDVSARLGHSKEALAHFGNMLKLAWRLDLPGKGGAAHARMGRIFRALGDFRRALAHLELAQVLFDLASDRPGIAATLDDLGRVHLLQGRAEEALALHRSALHLRQELGDAKGRALTLSWMGLAEMQRGELPVAAGHFREALVQSRKSRDPHGIVFSLLDLGRLHREMGQLEEAARRLEEARALAVQMGERLYECHIGMQIGETLLAAGELVRAEAELEAVRATAQSFGAKRLAVEAMRALADARLAQGDPIGARDRAAQVFALAQEMGASPLVGAALRVLASAVAGGAPGDSDRGGPREMFDRAVELLGDVGAELELGRTLRAYADFEESTGRADAAIELRHQASRVGAAGLCPARTGA